MRKERKMRGFTLVELLIVLLILGILIGLAVPRYLTAIEKSKQTTFCSNVRNVVSAIETWRMDNATIAYPSTASVIWIISSTTAYFSQPPENPYTGTVLTPTTDLTGSTAKGYFYYNTVDNGASYEIDTEPDCGIK